MPAAFDACVANGGRVRTKKLEGEKYMHICFIGGKSYAGEVKTKEELEQEAGELELAKKKKEEKAVSTRFNEELTFSFGEQAIDEAKRTVRVCALAPCLSRNNRYYSPQVVESASGKLVGKRSFADHDDRSTTKLIGKIVNEQLVDGKLYADIKISKAKGTASQTWDKIKDGTIDAVSIAADGDTRRVKMGEKIVDEVTKLDIKSVDFVTEGGVPEAKVLQVFENKDIPQTSEVKEEVIESLEQLKEQYPDFVAEIEEKMKDELETLRKENEALKLEKMQKELDEFKETAIKKMDVLDKVKDILRGRVTGKSKEEITASLEKEYEYIQQVTLATTKEAKVEGVPEAKKKVEENQPWTTSRVREDQRIPEEHKLRCCELLVEEGSKVMLDYLKGFKIEL